MHHRSFSKRCIIFGACAFAALWGVPWISVGAAASVIFPTPELQKLFSFIFAIGILITVGLDGLWLMLENIKTIEYRLHHHELLATALKKREPFSYTVIIPIFLSVFSCIAPVYASIKFNASFSITAVVITFVRYMSYGVFGYSRLIITLLQRIKEIQPSHPRPTTESLILIKNLFALTSAILIAFSSTLVSILLVKEFFLAHVCKNYLVAMILAILAEIPNAVIVFLAVREVFGRFFETLFIREQRNPLLKKIFPRASWVMSVFSFVIALTAPSAGSYITYATLKHAGVNAILLWIATLSIITTRFVFSNFTLNKFSNQLLFWLAEKRGFVTTSYLNPLSHPCVVPEDVPQLPVN